MTTDRKKVIELLAELESKIPKLKKGHGWKKLFDSICIGEQAQILAQIIELLLIQQDRIMALEQELEELKK